MIEQYDDFMSGILEQLYQNRENHQKHSARDMDYMFKIGAEQFGQLGKALADNDIELAQREVYHTAAILFELHVRLKGNHNANGDNNCNCDENSRVLGCDTSAAHQGEQG